MGVRLIRLLRSLAFNVLLKAMLLVLVEESGCFGMRREFLLIFSLHEQVITATLTTASSETWLISAVYASLCYVKRNSLWEHLDYVANTHERP